MQGVEYVDIPAEENADFGRSSTCDRSHRGYPRHQANRFLDWTGDRQHLHVNRRDAIVNKDHDAREIGLWKDGDWQLEDENDSCEREAENDENHCSAVR